MGTFLEAQTAVATLTRRGADKADFIKQKINSTVRFISATGRYPADLSEVTYTGAAIVAANLRQSLILPERTRVVAYVQDPARNERINVEEVGYILDRPLALDVAYQAGNVLQVRIAEAPTTLNVGVYRYPAMLVADNDINWILADLFDLVTDYTAAHVLTLLGEKELVSSITQFAGSQLQVYVQDRINALYGR
jgi:hypothetical protein